MDFTVQATAKENIFHKQPTPFTLEDKEKAPKINENEAP
jgi:hypothetical protein